MLAPHDVVSQIAADQHVYATLYVRWTIVYWILTVLAAGTAISTAIRSAYGSYGSQQNSNATSQKALPAQLDRWLVGLSAITVVATVLLGAMSPQQTADRYRFGDLLLQDALTDYRASQQQDADARALLSAWHRAQDVLEGGIVVLASNVAGSPQGGTPIQSSAAPK